MEFDQTHGSASSLHKRTFGRGVEFGPFAGGPAADNQLTPLIAVVRGANENKCEPLHAASTTNGSETARGHGQVRVFLMSGFNQTL